MNDLFKPRITVFHCINTFGDGEVLPVTGRTDLELKFVKLPCSSLVKDVYLLRAFEAGADAVAVMVCPEGACRYVEGNLRAKKRLTRVKALLDEIGLGGDRLSLFNVAANDSAAVETVFDDFRQRLMVLGASPAR
ncbi:MAG: hydrogenase iron-sulfur subunit [Desulfobacterales bacterium]|nr:hydrogenase iron-sulfur subunit [Desulfobacterales bacterium]